MRQKFVKVELKKDNKVIQVLPGEVEVLRNAGLIKEDPQEEETLEEDPQEGENHCYVMVMEPEQKERSGYKLPVLTKGERRARVEQAQRLKREGYSQREIARRLGVSHTAIQKWFKKKKSMWQPFATFCNLLKDL